MDFVSRLINEGYCEEDIGDILESLYLIEKNGGGNVLMEEQEYIVEVRGFLIRQLAKLKGLKQTPAVQKQIKRLEGLIKGGGKKADDAGALVKTDKFNQTKPGSTTYKPGAKPDAKSGAKPTKPDAKATKPKPKDKPKIPGWVKSTAALGTGLAIGTQLPQATSTDTESSSSSTPSTTEPGSTPSTTTNGGNGKPTREYGWWKKKLPKMPGYSAEPGLSAYRNVRTNINSAYEIVVDYILTEGHADTIEEAEYVFSQMEFEHIIDIIEAGEGRVNLTYPAGHPKYGQPLKVDGKPTSVSKKTADWNSKMNRYKEQDPEGYKKAKGMMGPYGWTKPPKGYNPPDWM